MDATEQIIDSEELKVTEKKSPGGVKAIAVFSYIGKVLLILLSAGLLVGIFVSKDYMIDKVQNSDMSTEDWILRTIILCLIYIITSVVAMIGVRKMVKGKREGFFMHAGSNLVLIAFLFYGAGLFEYIIMAPLAFFILLYLPFIGKLKS